jgi:heme ABC exporter ATP-binding subunit CcmA
LTGVTRTFSVLPAVVGVDLVVQRGEVVLLQGPNGAGKSTLLRVIATALSPTYGRGSVLGFDLVRQRDAVRRRTDLLGHRTRLYEDLSATENLRFTCALFGADPHLVPRALARVGLAGVADERVGGFSQGMRQRVALARAMLRSTELLLLDEPYAGLDEQAKRVVDEAVLAAHAAGQTVVLTTHDATRAGLATRTVVMEAGRLRADPAPVVGRAATGPAVPP